jgi:hypothetical protein
MEYVFEGHQILRISALEPRLVWVDGEVKVPIPVPVFPCRSQTSLHRVSTGYPRLWVRFDFPSYQENGIAVRIVA